MNNTNPLDLAKNNSNQLELEKMFEEYGRCEAMIDNNYHETDNIDRQNELISLITKQIQSDLLNEVENRLMKEWDNIERVDLDSSTESWKNYKYIRNNTRDIIKKLAEEKGL